MLPVVLDEFLDGVNYVIIGCVVEDGSSVDACCFGVGVKSGDGVNVRVVREGLGVADGGVGVADMGLAHDSGKDDMHNSSLIPQVVGNEPDSNAHVDFKGDSHFDPCDLAKGGRVMPSGVVDVCPPELR